MVKYYTYGHIKKLADIVRSIDLSAVLRQSECIKDKFDKDKWHTSCGIISVSGQKFMNWKQDIGGGGAIDLVIHLKNYDFKTAVIWLSENFLYSNQYFITRKSSPQKILKLPNRDNNSLVQVTSYLMYNRHIPKKIVDYLIASNKLYADKNGNAVFLLLGKNNTIVGAELRGTGKTRWTGMAPGSKKSLGCFYIKRQDTIKMVLCESAIDAISCFVLNQNFITLSTAGATSNPAWLSKLIKNGFKIYCGFDSDNVGDALAKKMMKLYPTVTRLRPTKHDWNDVLRSKLENQ